MTTFYFVRHAHANWIPDENRSLSESGLADAHRVAEILANYPITAVYGSPYRRANQTVEPLASQLNLSLQILEDLRERQLAAEPVENFEEAIQAVWNDPTFCHTGGESNVVAQKRGAALVARLREKHPNDQIVLGTHGNLMALTIQHFFPAYGYEFWQALTMPDIYQLELDKEPTLTRLWTESTN